MPSILFIGNSHTYYHEMPRMIVEFAKAADHAADLHIETSTASGVNLQWHWNHTPTRDLIEQGGWDAVVLQERSGGPLEDKPAMHEYARKLHGEIDQQGAETIFYMTWARTYQPGTQSEITEAYETIADELNATLAPVGEAWKRALNEDSGLRLHAPDGRHAAPAGSYVAACVFYALFFDRSPVGLPGTLAVDGREVVSLPDAQAELLQRTAFEALQRAQR